MVGDMEWIEYTVGFWRTFWHAKPPLVSDIEYDLTVGTMASGERWFGDIHAIVTKRSVTLLVIDSDSIWRGSEFVDRQTAMEIVTAQFQAIIETNGGGRNGQD